MSAKTSIRRCSRVLVQRRTSIYYKHKRNATQRKNEDEEIAKILKEKAVENPNWGFRLLFYWIRTKGKKWNSKWVYRVSKAEKLNLRTPKVRKKVKRVAINPLPAQQINQGWSMDFLSDVLVSNEKKVRILDVLDGCSRKVLLCFAATSIKSRKLVKPTIFPTWKANTKWACRTSKWNTKKGVFKSQIFQNGQEVQADWIDGGTTIILIDHIHH